MSSSPSLVDTIEETCTGNRDAQDRVLRPVVVNIVRDGGPSRSRSPPFERIHELHPPSFVDRYIQSGRGLNDLFDLRADFRISAKAKGDREKPTRRYHPGAIKAYVPEDRWDKIKNGVPIPFHFACWKDGELKEDLRNKAEYHPNHDHNDAWLVRHMNFSYANKFGGSYFSLRTIGFAKYIRYEDRSKVSRESTTAPRKDLIPGKDMVVTAQQTIEDYNPERGINSFLYRFHHPPRKSRHSQSRVGLRSWLGRMENLAGQAKGDTYFIIELFEAPNARTIYFFLLLSMAVSTAIGISWAILKKDVSAGIGIAAYITGCFALFLALMGAGSFMGLERPDSYSWAYDTATGKEAWEPAKIDQHVIFEDTKHWKEQSIRTTRSPRA